MTPDENTQAVLLLSAYFSKARKGDPTPLTPAEYGRLSFWLAENQYQPKDLLSRFEELSQAWADPKRKITLDRLQYLLGRGAAMGLALEKWSSAGIWILTLQDPDYPDRLKKKLEDAAPPVLFGTGHRALVNAGGLAMVGSRTITDADENLSKRIAHDAAQAGLNVVSGGAKGVDQTAMLGALEIDGTALGVLANGLLTAAVSGRWRPHLRKKDLCLISPYFPEAGFDVGNAMGRNKYIYCLADYALIIRSDKGKGGTWAGATEALRKKFVPVLVNRQSDAEGNRALLDMGAVPVEPPPSAEQERDDWLSQFLRGVDAKTPQPRTEGVGVEDSEATEEAGPKTKARAPDSPTLFFDYFVEYLTNLLAVRNQVTLKELKQERPDLTPKQLTEWLGQAVAEGSIERPKREHRYTLKAAKAEQKGLFDFEEEEPE